MHISGSVPCNHVFPVESKVANIGTDEDTSKDVAIVVHGEPTSKTTKLAIQPHPIFFFSNLQHHNIRRTKLKHVQKRANSLLQNSRSKRRNRSTRHGSRTSSPHSSSSTHGSSSTAVTQLFNSRAGSLDPRQVLIDEEAVVFAGSAAEALEGGDEDDGSDAGAGELAVGFNVPLVGEEAAADCVDVEEHLYCL